MHLIELKKCFDQYKDFWTQWKNYKHSGLDSRATHEIEMLRDNDFQINTAMLEKFHTQEEIFECLAKPLIKILEDNYAEYKEWVSMMFQHAIVKYATALGIDMFCKLPINSLPISDRDKAVLLKFNCKTVGEMLVRYNSEDYLQEPVFKNVLKSKHFITNAPVKELFVIDEILSAKR